MAEGFDFSPLTDGEREAAAEEPVNCGESDTAKPTLPAADAEAPEAAAARLFGRAPDLLWRYSDAAGALAFCACRWNKTDGEKEIRPLSWFDGEGWRFAHWSDRRTLYNADRIAANPDAPMVVCEGEKAADAAARIFSKSIATTSSGGAGAASKTDWTALAGRRVLIWPDNDDPGRKYARDVAAILAEIDGVLSIIEPGRLIAPSGRGAEAGYDAADALAGWPDTVALRKAAAGLAKPFNPGPAYLSFPPYTMDARGLTVEKEVGKGEAKRKESHWIAAPFEVLGPVAIRTGPDGASCCGGGTRTGASTSGLSPTPNCTAIRRRFAGGSPTWACGSTGGGNAISSAIFAPSGRRGASPSFRAPAGMRSAGNPFSSCRARRSGGAAASGSFSTRRRMAPMRRAEASRNGATAWRGSRAATSCPCWRFPPRSPARS
jgi:hypothetical protein